MLDSQWGSLSGHSGGEGLGVTEKLASFSEKGILLEGGQELEADIIVTATGLNLSVCGGVEFRVQGEKVDLSESVSYKGTMYTGFSN